MTNGPYAVRNNRCRLRKKTPNERFELSSASKSAGKVQSCLGRGQLDSTFGLQRLRLMKRQEITTALAARSPTDLWAALLGHARTLQPFWAGAVVVFAGRTSLPDEKRDGYLDVITSAFDKMDEWRRGT